MSKPVGVLEVQDRNVIPLFNIVPGLGVSVGLPDRSSVGALEVLRHVIHHRADRRYELISASQEGRLVFN